MSVPQDKFDLAHVRPEEASWPTLACTSFVFPAFPVTRC